MENNLKKAFLKAKYEPAESLSEKIWNNILLREKIVSRFKLGGFSFLGLLSLIGLVPAFQIVLNDFARSGFYEYSSLLFSNIGHLSAYWQELALSLIEALPIASILFSTALVFIFFLSLRFVLQQIIKGQLIFTKNSLSF